MGSGGAGKGKAARPTEGKKHANAVNAIRKSQGKPTKSAASVSRSKARSQAYHARISQPVPGECIGAPVQVPPEPPAAPTRNPVSLKEGPGASRDEGEALPSGQPEGTDAHEEEGVAPPSQMVAGQSAAASSVPSPGANSGRLLTMEAKPVVKLRPPPLRLGASGLPEVPLADFREAKSFQGKRLSKQVFLTSIRLIRGLCCYGCNVSFAIGELSSHVFSARHQQMCLEFAG